MKKTILTLALFAGVLFASSGYNDKVFGTGQGDLAPVVSFTEGETPVSVDQFRGKYLLLSFWSSTDARSRVDVNKYSSWIGSMDADANVNHVAVNFDTNRTLFDEIVRRDNLTGTKQFNVQGEIARDIIESYGLSGGFGSLLIDPQGRVAAINPSKETLTAL